MSDPLSLVRQATITGTPVSYSDGNYIFGEFKFHESTKTFFKRSLKSPTDVFYSLKDIIFFLENAEMSVADYRRKAVESRITAVVEHDRHSLKDYLTGVVETCPQIDLTAAAEFARSSATALSTSSTAENAHPQITLENMQQQRERHAAMLEKTVSKSKGLSSSGNQAGLAADKLEELRSKHAATKKRKANSEGEVSAEDARVDRAYLEADTLLLARLRADETPAFTRSTVLTSSEMDFKFAIKLFNDRVLKPKDAKAAPTAPNPVAKPHRPTDPSKSGESRAPSKAGGPQPPVHSSSSGAAVPVPSARSPIIIVPSAVTSVITAMNARDFFVDGLFVPAEEKRAAGARREKEQSILRPASGSTPARAYKVIDDPTRLTDAEWGRVVAVLATGQQWQFKGWKYSNPAQLFQQVQGVHVTMDDRAVDVTVLSWNCKVLKVNQFKQHLNAAAAKEFWTHVDDFVRLRKPQLATATADQRR